MLVDAFYDIGLFILVDIGDHVSEFNKSESGVCSPKFRHGVFTTAAYDNIDHNPSPSTSLRTLHETASSFL